MEVGPGTRLGAYAVVGEGRRRGAVTFLPGREEETQRAIDLATLEAPAGTGPEALRRFVLDAQAAGALAHASLAPVRAAGVDDGVAWWAGEGLAGATLAEAMERGPVPPADGLAIGLAVARALVAAHDHGLAHGALSPAFVLVAPDGTAALTGFGVAALGDAGPADHRADLLALGALLRDVLGGRVADPELDRLVAQLLEKDPAARPSSAREVVERLAPIAAAAGARRRRVRRRTAVFAAVALAALVAGGFAVGRASSTVRRTATRPSPRAAPAPPAEAPLFRRLTFRRGQIWSARFAPDTNTVVYGASWDGGPFHLHTTLADGEGHESRLMDLPAGDVLSISKAGEMLVSLGRRFTLSWMSRGTLARVSLVGRAPRPLLEDVQEADWAADGAIAVVRQAGAKMRLELPAGHVLYETAGWLSHARVSPEGDRVAFFAHPQLGDNRGTVMVVDLDRRARTRSQGWGPMTGLAWSPHGDEVWFTAAEEGNHWIYAVAERARERLVARAPGDLTLHDVAPDGRALVAVDDINVGIRGQFPGDSAERGVSWFGFSVVADVAADGETMLFSEQGDTEGPLYGVYVARTHGTDAPVRLGDGMAVTLSPDGQWALALRFGTATSVVLLPIGAGEPRVVPTGDLQVSDARFLGGMERLVLRAESEGSGRFWVQDVDGANRRAVTEPGQFVIAVPSNDGQKLAAIDPQDRLWIVPLDGSPPRPLEEAPRGMRPVRWADDDRSVWLSDSAAPSLRIHRMDAATGRTRLWREVAPPDPAGLFSVPFLVMNPAGTAYAYTYARDLSELYVVEGLR